MSPLDSGVLVDPLVHGRVMSTPASDEFMELVERRAWAEVGDLLARTWDELWWAVPASLLREVLLRVPRIPLFASPGAEFLARMLGVFDHDPPAPAAGAERVNPTTTREPGQVVADRCFVDAVRSRLEGRVHDAWRGLESSSEPFQPGISLPEDRTLGKFPSRQVEAGLIALLNERFGMARMHLGAAARVKGATRFPFVARRAAGLLAVVHVAEGNHPAADLWIRRAEEMPRTQAWSELRTDSDLGLARFMLAVDRVDLPTARELVKDYPSPFDVGPLWPFLAETLTTFHQLEHTPHSALSMWREVEETLPSADQLQGIGHRIALQGPVRLALGLGALEAATRRLSGPPTMALRVLEALTDYVAGDPQQAVAGVRAVLPEAHEHPRTLIDCYCVLAAAHEALGEPRSRDQALDLLLEQTAMTGIHAPLVITPAPLAPFLLDRDLPAPVRSLLSGPRSPSSLDPLVRAPLSAAEIGVVTHLAAGRTRAETAALLHLSENTVKTHLRHIYAKLGVSSREAAVIRAREIRALLLRAPQAGRPGAASGP